MFELNFIAKKRKQDNSFASQTLVYTILNYRISPKSKKICILELDVAKWIKLKTLLIFIILQENNLSLFPK